MARKKTHSGNPRKTASDSKGNDNRHHSESERAFGSVFDKSGSVGGVYLPQLVQGRDWHIRTVTKLEIFMLGGSYILLKSIKNMLFSITVLDIRNNVYVRGIIRSRKLTERQIICQSANYLPLYKSDHL